MNVSPSSATQYHVGLQIASADLRCSPPVNGGGKIRVRFGIAVAVFVSVLIPAAADAAQLKLMVSGAMAEPIREIANDFARRSGNTIDLIVGTTQSHERRIRAGEIPDLIEVNSEAMSGLAKSGTIMPDTRVELGRANIAIAVPEGAAVPKLVTPDDLKHALLSARRVALTDPKIHSQATEAIQLLFRRLGVQEEISRKTVPGATGLDAVTKLAAGEADLAVSFESEILPVKGARFAGRVPDALQDPTVFEGAVAVASPNPGAAKTLLHDIAGPEGRQIIRRAGLEPLSPN